MNNLKTICSNFIDKNLKCEECLEKGFDYQCKDIKLARGKLYSQQETKLEDTIHLANGKDNRVYKKSNSSLAGIKQ
jgi:hypothetical protein